MRKSLMACECGEPHYPLRYFRKGGYVVATRGVKPVENILADGWEEINPSDHTKLLLGVAYDNSHRFDWFHTPTYLDDRETHLRMKEQTRRA